MLETEVEHTTKEGLWNHLGFAIVNAVKADAPTPTETVDCTEFVKERNERFQVHKDNMKKVHSLTHGHCSKAMQTRLENDSKFKDEVKGDLFKMMKATKLKMHDLSKVKCPFVTIFEQLERLLNAKQEEDEASIEYTKDLSRLRTMLNHSWAPIGYTNSLRMLRNSQMKQMPMQRPH